jgi:hypothetical protein
MNKTNFRSKSLSIQAKIEKAMRFYSEGFRWEIMVLFSSEGLPLARYGKSPDYHEDHLLEFSFSLIQSANLIQDDSNIKEFIIHGKNRKKLIFKFFHGLDDEIILTAVASGKKGYRRAMSNLTKWIQNLT